MSEPAARDARRPAASDPTLAGELHEGGPDEPPPVLGRWSRLYLIVVLELVAVIAILLWLTRRFA